MSTKAHIFCEDGIEIFEETAERKHFFGKFLGFNVHFLIDTRVLEEATAKDDFFNLGLKPTSLGQTKFKFYGGDIETIEFDSEWLEIVFDGSTETAKKLEAKNYKYFEPEKQNEMNITIKEDARYFRVKEMTGGHINTCVSAMHQKGDVMAECEDGMFINVSLQKYDGTIKRTALSNIESSPEAYQEITKEEAQKEPEHVFFEFFLENQNEKLFEKLNYWMGDDKQKLYRMINDWKSL